MTVRFEIRPLLGWDRPRTALPRAATFRVGWEETLDSLKHEVDLLGGNVIACQIGVTDSDVRRDGMLRAGTRVSGFQGVKMSFDSRHGPLAYATDAFTFWKDNVRAITLGLTALRVIDRYGITRSGEQYRGWTAIAAKPMEDTLTPESAILVLADATGARPDFVRRFVDILINSQSGNAFVAEESVQESKEAITRLYRQAAKKHHPDVIGGDGSVMRLITRARDVLLATAR